MSLLSVTFNLNVWCIFKEINIKVSASFQNKMSFLIVQCSPYLYFMNDTHVTFSKKKWYSQKNEQGDRHGLVYTQAHYAPKIFILCKYVKCV
jgi:hypothetical protein